MDRPIFPAEYFYDEVREGFYVSEMMKRFWAAQLVILYEIVKICDRHGLKWYVDMGTLLGAIRHKGYVPWDDDLDVSLNRDDWEEFYKYARDELPEGYILLSIRENDEYNNGLGRITNGHGINTYPEHLEKFCGCPYCVGVDLYPIDRLYRNPDRENDRKRRAKDLNRLSNLIADLGMNSHETRKLMETVEHDNHMRFHRDQRIVWELRLLFEKISMECRDEDYEEVALMITWLLQDWANCPRDCYEERIDLPFENMTVKGSAEYDKLLTIYYHDYMVVKKGGGAHEYPIYRSQEDILRKSIGHNPYRYTFDRNSFTAERKPHGFKDSCNDLMNLLIEASEHIVGSELQDSDELQDLLAACQETAIALGNMLEEKYGEGIRIVHRLEDYCEGLYRISQDNKMGIGSEIKDLIRNIRSEFKCLISESVREVVFLPCRAAWWDTMRPVYEKLLADPGVNVRVLPIPYYDTDIYRRIGQEHDDSEFFRAIAGFTDEREYDLKTGHPDVIITQFPFDGWSCALTVREEHYSESLSKLADELWYVPPFDADPPVSQNDKAYSALASLIEQPAVFNSDRIILKREEMRRYYIDKLMELTCGCTDTDLENAETVNDISKPVNGRSDSYDKIKEYWEKKIEVL